MSNNPGIVSATIKLVYDTNVLTLTKVTDDREAHGKKSFDVDNDDNDKPKKKRDNTSKKKLKRRKYEEVTEKFPEVETIVADSAYKTPHISNTNLK